MNVCQASTYVAMCRLRTNVQAACRKRRVNRNGEAFNVRKEPLYYEPLYHCLRFASST